MRKVRKPRVIYAPGTVQKISVNMKIPERSVLAALRFDTNSETAKSIRDNCVRYYGGKVIDVTI